MNHNGAVQVAERLRAVNEHIQTLQSLGMPPETCLTVLRSLYDWAGIPAPLPGVASIGNMATDSSEEWFSCNEIAERVDAYSVSNKPHQQFIGAMVRHLGPLRPDIEFMVSLVNAREKLDVLQYKYSEVVLTKVRGLLDEWGRPSTVCLEGRVYYLRYRSHSNSNQHLKVS